MSIQQAIEAIKLKREKDFLPKIEDRILHLEKLEDVQCILNAQDIMEK